MYTLTPYCGTEPNLGEIMGLTIGKLGAAAGVHVETIRFYERKGLIKQPKKTDGFRKYSSDYIARIRFIKRSQELGFTLKEAKNLLDLRVRDKALCSDVLDKTEGKIHEIDEKIRDLKKMKKSLLRLADCCLERNIPIDDCPILDCFMEKSL